jgi:hypothetical protein
MVLLFVPVALLSPTLSRLWLLPLCTPLINLITDAVFPLPAKVGAFSPDLLRVDVPWLLVELAIGFMLTTTVEQRARLRERFAPSRWGRARVPARAATARG